MSIINLISSFNSNVRKIYHMADLHIRLGNERHSEYREVFEKLYATLKKDSENLKNNKYFQINY